MADGIRPEDNTLPRSRGEVLYKLKKKCGVFGSS